MFRSAASAFLSLRSPRFHLLRILLHPCRPCASVATNHSTPAIIPAMALELIFLGTGTSAGVPMIGCRCEVCTSDDPRDQRTRPSVMIRYPASAVQRVHTPAEDAMVSAAHAQQGAPTKPKSAQDPFQGKAESREPDASAAFRHYLIDTTPEMRLQTVRHGINRLDAVLYTHAHADHIFGLDDLRRFNALMDRPIDLYAEELTAGRIRTSFPYIFESHNNLNKTWVAQLEIKQIAVRESFALDTAKWTPVRLMHGKEPVLGFRVDLPASKGKTESLAYCTDVSHVPDESIELLAGLDVLVIDGLRFREHPTHLTIAQAITIIECLNPKRAYLTHIAHDVKHAAVDPTLPANVNLSYDGLIVDCASASSPPPS